VQNRVEYLLFKFFVALTNLLGWRLSRSVAKVLGSVVYRFFPIRKDVVLKNLSLAFPEKSHGEIERLAKESYKSFAVTFFESFMLPKMSDEEILAKVDFKGREVLDKIVAEGKSAILLTAHMGNWELGAIVVGLLCNGKLSVLTKPQRNPFVSKWYDDMRASHGNEVINVGAGTKGLIQALRNNRIVGIVGDQRGKRESPRVKVFGQDTALYFGTASIALKTGVPVILVFLGRKDNGVYEVSFSELEYSDIKEREDAALIFNQRYMNALEEFVRRYPEQWFWMHNIWKY
jgi:KDO2-lipid IV(A) lauroyltransferase